MDQQLADSAVIGQMIPPGFDVSDLVPILVPLALFTAVAVVFSLYFHYRYKTRRDLQSTIKAVIEQGQELTPELLERLGQQARPAGSDLRRGVVLVAVGVALAALGSLVGEEEAVGPMLAFGMFPFILGIAYLGLWRFGDDRKR